MLITQQANGAVRGWAGERRAEAIFASPPPVWFWRRNLVWTEGDCYRHSRFDPLGGGLADVTNCQPANFEDPLVHEAIRQDPRLRKFLRWSILPVAEVERGRCSARVTIGDARYSEPAARSRLSRQTVVPTGGPGCQSAGPSQ